MGLTLYQLSTEFETYLNADDEEIGSALADITAGQIEVKMEGWCHFFATVEGEIEKFKAEEKRISAARKSMENKLNQSKEYVKTTLLNADLMKINSGTFKVSVSPTAGSLIVDDPTIIPAQFVTYIPATTAPNKDEIKAAIKNGETVPGAHVEPGFSLRIK